MQSALASTFMQAAVGDPADIANLQEFLGGDATLDIPEEDPYSRPWRDYNKWLTNYFDRMGGVIGNPLNDYDQAYRDVNN
jgi:hypothetical protein